MIIFTITNKSTSQVYVGSTRNDLSDQWEKMVAAAEQHLEFPLYSEIRVHGSDAFIVEEWDIVEDRNELYLLEQEAIETFNAKSLRGYKTSTVKIQPKKKTRARKSKAEKELANIFAKAATDNNSDDDVNDPPSLNVSTETQQTPETPAAETPVQKNSSKAKAKAKAKTKTKTTPASPSGNILNFQAPQATDKPVEKESSPELPENYSQANAMVQMSSIDLSDDISAQLAALTAAADAVLAGDTGAAKELSSQKKNASVKPEPAMTDSNTVTKKQSAAPKEVVIQLDPKELRIRQAIERHRKTRSQKSSEKQSNERQKIAKLLSDLNNRAQAMNAPCMTAA